MATDEEIVTAASEAARSIVFSRYDRDEVIDLDVTVAFEEGDLSIDLYLNAPGDADRVAEDAALAAREAVDDLLE
ncbi:MAG: DUF3194 domain-containing protein [Halobacteriales archaeon]